MILTNFPLKTFKSPNNVRLNHVCFKIWARSTLEEKSRNYYAVDIEGQ